MNGRIFISTTGDGLARAECAASGSWHVQTLLEGQQVNCLVADSHDSSVIFAGTQGNGIMRSDDGGKTWRPMGLDGYIVKSINASRAESGVVYAGTKPPFVFVSRDSGASWKELESFRQMRRWWWFQPAEVPLTAYIQAIAPSPADPDVIAVGVEACGVFRSSDAGLTWTGHLNGSVRDCHTLTFHANNGNWLYEAGGTGAGTAFSRDGGVTWTQAKAGLDRHYGWACVADPVQPKVWYLSVSPGSTFPSFVPAAHVDGKANAYIFRKRGDAPWEKLGGGLLAPLNYMAYALVTDPVETGQLYAGLSNGDVWHTADYGDTWQQLAFNLGSIARDMVMVCA